MNQQQNHQHKTTACPQRSMAWITVNEYNEILGVTKEMIQLLNYDPTNQYLDSIWKKVESDQSYHVVSTLHSLRTLCVCEHLEENNKRTLICTDITDLNQMYNKRHNNLSITRLTMYGTIEAAFQSQTDPSPLSVGQPMMRYIHSDDVQEFCASLNEASKCSTIVSVQLRMIIEEVENEEEEYQLSEFTVMTIEGGRKILCLIKPTITTTATTNLTNKPQKYCCDNVLQETVTQMQTKFWYAIENGLTLAARSLASSLVLLIQTIWQIWYDKESKTWTGLFSTSSEYILRKVVKCTKERSEIDAICKLVSWTGISQKTSKSFIDTTLDQTTEWLISKTHFGTVEYDTVV